MYKVVDTNVTVLGFPLIYKYDQHRNIKRLVRAKIAISIKILTVFENMLFNAISEVISNKKRIFNIF